MADKRALTTWAVRQAEPDELATVLHLLHDRVDWLHARGIVNQWPRPFPTAAVTPSLRAGQTWLVEVDGRAVATVTLSWHDDVWTDHPGTAGYVHRLAVSGGFAGLGAEFLIWAANRTRTNGREFLRLDCVATNTRLRRYYLDAGFEYRGAFEVHGLPGDRRADGPATTLSLYELDV